jgi:Protein of unknown function (DUF2934)
MPHTSAISSKTNAKLQSATPKNDIWEGIDREEMISVAAYFRAENRGFGGCDSLADWLAAEAEIDAMLKNHHKDIEIH